MNTAVQTPELARLSKENCAVSFDGDLVTGELLTGTPTVTVLPLGPIITAIATSSAIVEILGAEVPIGRAVVWTMDATVAGGGSVVKGKTYRATVTVATDAGRVLVQKVKFIGC